MNMRIRTYLQHPKMRVVLSVMAVLSIVAGVAMAGAAPQNADASNVMNVVKNGSFEGGFESQPGCGMVGAGWTCFTNGGTAAYGFYDDMWEPVVADGTHSQLIEINTKGIVSPDADRYAGIYQTVKVMPGETDKLNLAGMLRTTNFEGDPWRYRVEVGYTHGPHGDWQHVMNWQDVGWDDYFPRTEPGNFSGFMGQIKAKDEHLTLYIRVWKKWGVPDQELDVNLDSISLVGLAHGMGMGEKPMEKPMAEMKPEMKPEGRPAQPMTAMGEKPMDAKPMPPMPKEQLVCGGPNLVYNGGFEHGFNPASIGHVGRGWGSFTNGGAANYGFYDDMWPPVASGEHAQLIEINTKGIVAPENDRYAGIYQRIGKLEPGKTYELTVRGVLRGEGGEGTDPNRWEAQTGINWGGDVEWQHVNNWQAMDLGGIQVRTAPESIGAYSTHFTAKDASMVLFLQGWLKWGVSNVEMDLDLDDISVVACEKKMMGSEKPMKGEMGGMMMPMGEGSMPERPMGGPQAGEGPMAQGPMDGPPAGEGPMAEGPMDGPPAGEGPMAEGPMDGPPAGEGPMAEGCVYVVKPGDSLSAIAVQHDTTIAALAEANGISDPRFIYVGQRLTIPGCEMTIAPITLIPMASAGTAEIAAPASTMHRVGLGETLAQIADLYGADPQAVAELNSLAATHFLYVGQQLHMP